MIYNQIKTILYLSILSGLLLFLGHIIDGVHGVKVAFIMALVMNVFTYFFSEKLVLRMYRAQQLSPEQYPHIHTMVAQLAQTMNIPKPKLWLVDTPVANAFATGRNPSHASVAVTTGILSILTERELRGVLAHELSHVKNRDILIGTIAAIMATAIGYIAYMARTAAFYGSFNQNEKRRAGGALFLIFVAILLPFAASLIQLAISRTREYLADESGAHESGDPIALADALQKLQNNTQTAHFASKDIQYASTASLFIVYPYIGKGWLSLFATHPPMHKRIERLHAMAQKD